MKGVHCQIRLIMTAASGNLLTQSTWPTPERLEDEVHDTEHRVEHCCLPQQCAGDGSNEKRRDQQCPHDPATEEGSVE